MTMRATARREQDQRQELEDARGPTPGRGSPVRRSVQGAEHDAAKKKTSSVPREETRRHLARQRMPERDREETGRPYARTMSPASRASVIVSLPARLIRRLPITAPAARTTPLARNGTGGRPGRSPPLRDPGRSAERDAERPGDEREDEEFPQEDGPISRHLQSRDDGEHEASTKRTVSAVRARRAARRNPIPSDSLRTRAWIRGGGAPPPISAPRDDSSFVELVEHAENLGFEKGLILTSDFTSHSPLIRER